MHTFAGILARLETTLADGIYDRDVTKAAAVSMELSELLRSTLDVKQVAALDAARRFWRGAGSEKERLAHLATIDESWRRFRGRMHLTDRDVLIDRLVFGALQSNEGLSISMAEFLVDLTETLGLNPKDVIAVFSRHVPNLGLS